MWTPQNLVLKCNQRQRISWSGTFINRFLVADNHIIRHLSDKESLLSKNIFKWIFLFVPKVCGHLRKFKVWLQICDPFLWSLVPITLYSCLVIAVLSPKTNKLRFEHSVLLDTRIEKLRYNSNVRRSALVNTSRILMATIQHLFWGILDLCPQKTSEE